MSKAGIGMSYSDIVKYSVIKWLGIFLLVMIFIPIVNYNESLKPVWAFLVDINWEEGLFLQRYSDNRMELGIYIAMFEFIIGILLMMIGLFCENSIKMELGL